MNHERLNGHENIAEVIYMTDIAKDSMKKIMSPEQSDYFRSQAAYWSEVQEMAERQLEYATSQREYALKMLGMLPATGGYPE